MQEIEWVALVKEASNYARLRCKRRFGRFFFTVDETLSFGFEVWLSVQKIFDESRGREQLLNFLTNKIEWRLIDEVRKITKAKMKEFSEGNLEPEYENCDWNEPIKIFRKRLDEEKTKENVAAWRVVLKKFLERQTQEDKDIWNRFADKKNLPNERKRANNLRKKFRRFAREFNGTVVEGIEIRVKKNGT